MSGEVEVDSLTGGKTCDLRVVDCQCDINGEMSGKVEQRAEVKSETERNRGSGRCSEQGRSWGRGPFKRQVGKKRMRPRGEDYWCLESGDGQGSHCVLETVRVESRKGARGNAGCAYNDEILGSDPVELLEGGVEEESMTSGSGQASEAGIADEAPGFSSKQEVTEDCGSPDIGNGECRPGCSGKVDSVSHFVAGVDNQASDGKGFQDMGWTEGRPRKQKGEKLVGFKSAEDFRTKTIAATDSCGVGSSQHTLAPNSREPFSHEEGINCDSFQPRTINLNPKSQRVSSFSSLIRHRRPGRRPSSKLAGKLRKGSGKGSGKELKGSQRVKLTAPIVVHASVDDVQSPKKSPLSVHDLVVQALDELHPRSTAVTQHSSAVRLLGMALDKSGREFLQGSTLTRARVLQSFESVLGKKDTLVTLSCAYLLLALVQGSVDLKAFASKSTMQVLQVLLMQDLDCRFDDECPPDPSTTNQAGEDLDNPQAFLLKVMKSGPLSSCVPSSETGCPCSLALTSLCFLINNNFSSPDLEVFKESMRMQGVLDAICDQMVAFWDKWEQQPVPSTQEGKEERVMWKVDTCLNLLSCVTNSNSPSQKHVLEKLVQPRGKESKMPFPAFIARKFSMLRPKFQALALFQDHGIESLQGLIGLLMNLGHGSQSCVEMLANQGVIEACGDLVVFSCGGMRSSQTGGVSDMAGKLEEESTQCRLLNIRDRLVENASSIERMLGLLINVCEDSRENCKKLISMTVPDASSLKCDMNGGILELLSWMLLAFSVWRSSGEPGTVTIEDLEQKDKVRAGELVKMCTGVLLGYLVEDDPAMQVAVAGYLSRENLQLVVKQVRLMLSWCTMSSSPVTNCNKVALERMMKKLT